MVLIITSVILELERKNEGICKNYDLIVTTSQGLGGPLTDIGLLKRTSKFSRN